MFGYKPEGMISGRRKTSLLGTSVEGRHASKISLDLSTSGSHTQLKPFLLWIYIPMSAYELQEIASDLQASIRVPLTLISGLALAQSQASFAAGRETERFPPRFFVAQS
jgi:hypothetical protein